MSLFDQISAFCPSCEQEGHDQSLMLSFLENGETPLSRDNAVRHFTVSAWIISKDGDSVLMVYHNIYRSWSWVGGHADGEEDLLSVALREAEEETGITGLIPAEGIFSLEILPVSGHEKRGKYVSSHLHYNVTYLFWGDKSASLRVKDDENSGVRWVPINEVLTACSEPWIGERVYKKLIGKMKNQ